MHRMIHQPHLRCVYRELQLSFISLLSLSLAYVGNILVRRYRPLTPCYAFILFSLTLLCVYFIFTYPAVRLFYFHLPCCAFILFLLTLLCVYFIFTYPALTLFFAYPAMPLPCCNLQDFFGSVCIADSTDNASPPAAPTWCMVMLRIR